jgi:hypothetical protein
MFSVFQIIENNIGERDGKYGLHSCSACRARKKKCDKKVPICSRCERLELECKSYDRGVKYFKPTHTTTESISRNSNRVAAPIKCKYINIAFNYINNINLYR